MTNILLLNTYVLNGGAFLNIALSKALKPILLHRLTATISNYHVEFLINWYFA